MEDGNLVPVQRICEHHRIELSFVQSLQDFGLLQLTTVEEHIFIPEAAVGELEKMISLHYELEVNLEGIDLIQRLLRQLEEAREEKARLERRLKFYERF